MGEKNCTAGARCSATSCFDRVGNCLTGSLRTLRRASFLGWHSWQDADILMGNMGVGGFKLLGEVAAFMLLDR